MMYLVGYDVNTTTAKGKKRLNKVAKLCCNYGQCVQNSLFECDLDSAQYVKFKDSLLDIADLKEDSIRIYHLGKKYQLKIEHFGIKDTYDPEDTLIL